MKLLLTLFLLSFSISAMAIDVGDGSDGTCAVIGPATTLIAFPKTSYQCTSVVIDGDLDDFSGAQLGAPLAGITIKSQGNVTIAALTTIDLSGANGAHGNIGGIALGGRAGAGGSAGGASTAGAGVDGGGSGKGTGGSAAILTPGPSPLDVGVGGGGGSYKTTGTDEPTDSIGNSVVANGPTYGSEINFENIFSGGSGGGAGGSGFDSDVSDTLWFGSSGGGGGGSLHIVAGGDITVDGSILSNGGAGGGAGPVPGPATIASGGGGGASGGAIWLQAAGNLTVNGTIRANGGIHGTNDNNLAGVGGDGGDGRIRLDDADAVISGGGVISPAAVNRPFTPSPISTSGSTALSRQYSSSISCAKVALANELPFNNLINVVLGMLLISAIHFSFSFSRKGKI